MAQERKDVVLIGGNGWSFDPSTREHTVQDIQCHLEGDLTHDEGSGVLGRGPFAGCDFFHAGGVTIVAEDQDVLASQGLSSRGRADGFIVIGADDQVDLWVSLDHVHHGLVAGLDVPSGGQAGDDLHIGVILEGIQEATDALGGVVAWLAFEDADVGFTVDHLGGILT